MFKLFVYKNSMICSILFNKIVFYSQQWILDKQDLVRERQLDLQILSEEEYQKIGIFFSNCKLKLTLQITKSNNFCLII